MQTVPNPLLQQYIKLTEFLGLALGPDYEVALHDLANKDHSIIAIANVVVQSNINTFGSDAMAGCGSYAKVEGFAFLPVTSFTMALTTFVGQNLGAGLHDRAKKGSRFGIIASVVIAEIIGVTMYLLAPQLVALFSPTPEVVELGTRQMRTTALFFCLLAYSHAIASICRGAGKAFVPMVIMLLFWCVDKRTGYYVFVVGLFGTLANQSHHMVAQFDCLFPLLPLLRLGPRL